MNNNLITPMTTEPARTLEEGRGEKIFKNCSNGP